MNKDSYFVDESALPEGLQKVIAAKRLLNSGQAVNATEAAKMAGISRSVFYKYKDMVHPVGAMDSVFTLAARLADRRGVLSHFTAALAEVKTSVLTLNQNIPANGTATVTLSIRGSDMPITVPELLSVLRKVAGVLDVDVLFSDGKSAEK